MKTLQPITSIATAGAAALLSALTSASAAENVDPTLTPFGFQSGYFAPQTQLSPNNLHAAQAALNSEQINDDSYAGSMYYDAEHSLLFFTGSTYGTYFDSATDLDSNTKGAMGMSSLEGGRDTNMPHLDNSDCFLGILKLPQPKTDGEWLGDVSNTAPWLIHMDEDTKNNMKGMGNVPELIYARRFGTPSNSEACSSIAMLPKVNDALLQTEAQLKLALLGHVNPTPLSSADLNAMGPVYPTAGEKQVVYDTMGPGLAGGLNGMNPEDVANGPNNGGRRNLRQPNEQASSSRQLEYNGNRGGFLHSISEKSPITQPGRAYGFIVDFDVSLTKDKTFTAAPNSRTISNAYGALLGGNVLESSPLVYPVAMAQNKRDPNQIYVVSMHSDDENVVLDPNFILDQHADMTVGGAGGSGSKLVEGVPMYGNDFYVKVQQLMVTPYEQLMGVEPTPEEKVKQTMTAGWGFGFKLNDADDVRPSTIVFVKGATPNDDLLLLGGTTRKDGELDGFITRLIPPAPSPVEDQTTGASVEDAIQDESVHPTKRIDSTTGRDETVTAICLPPPDYESGRVTHAYVVGSTTSDQGTQAIAYILKMRLDDLSTVWKEHLPSINPNGLGGDVLGEGCSVTPDGSMVYLSGTIDGGSALNVGIPNMDISPVGGKTDVFVVAFDTKFGNVQWAKQLGTVQDDKLARGGGVQADNDGNVIIMGSSRGGLQRPRPDKVYQRIASDIFIMSLSRTNGEYINAPFTGNNGAPVDSYWVAPVEPEVEKAEIQEFLDEKYEDSHPGGLSSGAKAGVVLVVFLGVTVGLLFIAQRRLKKRRIQRNTNPGVVLRGWDGDGFSYGSTPPKRKTGGPLSFLRGASASDDDWDDGTGSMSRNATWMGSGGGGGDDSSVGSSSSRDSKSKENADFLSSLREEAAATMSKMVKKSESETNDPRLDGGESIKSLLTHYREVKKGGLIEGGDDAESTGSSGSNAFRSNKSPPPPPPRRKNNNEQQAEEENVPSGDGLSEFTIV